MLPAQRTKFSTRQFTQPQLLAVLCLMRYEDWTFGETEVWFSEHSELRAQGEAALPTTPLRHELADWCAARRGTKG